MSDPIDILGVAIERLQRAHDQWKSCLIMQAGLGAAIETQEALARVVLCHVDAIGAAKADVDAIHDLIIELRNSCI